MLEKTDYYPYNIILKTWAMADNTPKMQIFLMRLEAE
jgi:hypothetical protein